MKIRIEMEGTSVTATADAREQVKRGRKAVRLLNAILQPRLAKNPELLGVAEREAGAAGDGRKSVG